MILVSAAFAVLSLLVDRIQAAAISVEPFINQTCRRFVRTYYRARFAKQVVFSFLTLFFTANL